MAPQDSEAQLVYGRLSFRKKIRMNHSQEYLLNSADTKTQQIRARKDLIAIGVLISVPHAGHCGSCRKLGQPTIGLTQFAVKDCWIPRRGRVNISEAGDLKTTYAHIGSPLPAYVIRLHTYRYPHITFIVDW